MAVWRRCLLGIIGGAHSGNEIGCLKFQIGNYYENSREKSYIIMFNGSYRGNKGRSGFFSSSQVETDTQVQVESPQTGFEVRSYYVTRLVIILLRCLITIRAKSLVGFFRQLGLLRRGVRT